MLNILNRNISQLKQQEASQHTMQHDKSIESGPMTSESCIEFLCMNVSTWYDIKYYM